MGRKRHMMSGARLVRGVEAVFLAALLAGCNGWLQVGFGPEHRRNNTVDDTITVGNVDSLSETWSTSFPGSVTEPILDENRVYVGTSLGTPTTASFGARAFNAESGGELWSTQDSTTTTSHPQVVPRSVALSAGALHSGGVGASSNTCLSLAHRLDPDSGAVKSTDPDVFRSASVISGEIVAYTQTTVRVPGDPCPNSNAFGPYELVVKVADDTQAVLWTAQLSPGSNPLTVFPPSIADGRIYASNGFGSVLSAFPAAGCGAPVCQATWSVDVGFLPVTPLVGEDGTVFTEANGTLFALDGATGAQLWHADTGGSILGLASTDSTVFTSGTDRLQAFSAAGCGSMVCSRIWSAVLPSSAASEPTVAGGVVYVGVTDAVVAFDADGCGAATCSVLETLSFTGPANHLALGQGRLVVAGSGFADLGQGTVHIAVYEPTT